MDSILQSFIVFQYSLEESSFEFSLVHISRDFHPHSPDPIRHHGLKSLLVSNPERKCKPRSILACIT